MNVSEQRDHAVAAAIDQIRQIEQQQGVNYDALRMIRDELIELSRDKELFPRSSFPATEDGGSAI